MNLLKRTEDIRVETEEEGKNYIEAEKQKAYDGGYEIVSYSLTHNLKKDDEFYLLRMVKKYWE